MFSIQEDYSTILLLSDPLEYRGVLTMIAVEGVYVCVSYIVTKLPSLTQS